LAGVSLYGAMMVANLSFSFGLCVVSAVMCFLCSILLFQDRRISLKRPMSTSQIHYANQGQIISSPNTQVVIAYSNQMQPPAYPAMNAHAQYGPPPAYLVAQQQRQFVQH
jgi:ABC-type transport system involved in Fe-S cluster assembly fused permease/ATPase subunit